MNPPPQAPSGRRRLAAIGAIVLPVAVITWTGAIVVSNVGRVVVQLALFAIATFAAWFTLTRVGVRRLVAAVIAVAAIVGVMVAGYFDDAGLPGLAVRIVLLLLAVALARFALGRDLRTLKEADLPGTHVPPAARGVLIMNLKSGGGKAERFHLEDECRKRGIEPVILRPGDDLLQLAERAVEGGADVIGMAGGDGSQALVASAAAQRGIPMVIVPAGTRNHLALDLGLDRDDVVGAIDAFGDAVERRMDLADVNGHVFVNNVSLGLYAAIVRSPEYRDAKVDTALGTIPKVLAPGTRPFDLRFAGPDGAPHDGAHVIQVSNNPYGESITGFGSRPRLDTGRLGIVTLTITDDRAAAVFLSALAAGHPDRYEGYKAWSSATFEVTSAGAIDVGLDGEALEMDPPLVFSIRPEPLRVRIPMHAIGYSPAAMAMDWRSAAKNLGRIAAGRPMMDLRPPR